jgi:hypothetical protein
MGWGWGWTEVHLKGFIPWASRMHLLRCLGLCKGGLLRMWGTAQAPAEPGSRHILLPLTLCPTCDPPKSTSEASSPSKCRPWGKLAPARATTVGKMSSTLQKEQDRVGPSSLDSFPGFAVIKTHLSQPRANTRSLPFDPGSLPACLSFRFHFDFCCKRGVSASRLCNQVLPGLKSHFCHLAGFSMPQFPVL